VAISKKDIELMYNFSKASFISLFIFLIIFYLSFKSSIISGLSPHITSILMFFSFLITLALSYRGEISKDTLTTLETLADLYPKVPSIIMGIGFSLLLILFLLTMNIPPIAPLTPLTVYGLFLVALMFFSFFIFIPFGFLLLIVSFYAKKYLEGQVSFTLKKANAILVDNVEDKNKIDTKNLKKYIYLTYINIEKKMGKLYTFDLEYTFLNYLPYYIEFAEKEQLKSLKDNLETMLKLVNDVNDKNEINWRSLIQEIKKLDDNIIRYLRESNFNLTNKKLPRRTEWILKNKETIVQVIGLIVPIILFILSILYKSKVP
jgi:ABC-type multidrug transport system fused ATPase/permease subunit